MEDRFITQTNLEDFRSQLLDEERAPTTVEKYMRDAQHFSAFVAQRPIIRQLVLVYKADPGGGMLCPAQIPY